MSKKLNLLLVCYDSPVFRVLLMAFLSLHFLIEFEF